MSASATRTSAIAPDRAACRRALARALPSLLLGLLACNGEASATAPPPESIKPLPATYVSSVARPTRPTSAIHTLEAGETLWDIARLYGVSAKQIMEANGFTPETARRLRTGAQIKIEGIKRPSEIEVSEPGSRAAGQPQALPELNDGAYHMLSEGESLWTLARLYDVPLERLLLRNGFGEDVYRDLRVGRPIIIPGIKASQLKQRAYDGTRRDGMEHTVAPGETVWDIARRFRVSVGEIMATNELGPDQVQNVRQGQRLFLPGVRKDSRGRVRRDTSARERRARAVAAGLGLGSLRAAGRLLHGQVEARWIAAAGGSKDLAGTLRWPVAQGWFVRGYGSGQDGYHRAMDISGKIGWNVRAAAAGIVGYAGDKVPGFGNMVMVVHPGGWVTLYAHNSVNFVAAGERVDKGAILAEVGSTGRSQGPHVHFELIHEGKNCDPAPLFRPGVRHRSGRFSNVPSVSWRDPARKPRQIKCQKRQKHPTGAAVVNENPSLDAQGVDESTTRELPAEEAR